MTPTLESLSPQTTKKTLSPTPVIGEDDFISLLHLLYAPPLSCFFFTKSNIKKTIRHREKHKFWVLDRKKMNQNDERSKENRIRMRIWTVVMCVWN
ncbi:hypothetical protein Hdeb2414_s0231g00841821 [Helianthus debilis subsp. tardiflorus]